MTKEDNTPTFAFHRAQEQDPRQDGNRTIRNWNLPRSRGRSRSRRLSSPEPTWEPRLPFELLFAYEDSTCRQHAISLHSELVTSLQTIHDIQSSWWKFSFLREPELLERAVNDALRADMIILAAHDEELPLVAESWIERWRASKEGSCSALVAIVDQAKSEAVEECYPAARLRNVARATQMTFFSKLLPVTDKERNRKIRHKPSGLPELVQQLLWDPGRPQPWGINE